MAPISDEIEIKDEPWIHCSEYDQVSYGVQVSRFLFHISIMISQLSKFDAFFSIISECLYICVYLYFYISFLQFDDDKDGSEITKEGEISVSEVFQWQTMKTENEGNRIGLCCRLTFFVFLSANLCN